MVYPCFIHGFVMVYQHPNRNMSITCDTRKRVWQDWWRSNKSKQNRQRSQRPPKRILWEGKATQHVANLDQKAQRTNQGGWGGRGETRREWAKPHAPKTQKRRRRERSRTTKRKPHGKHRGNRPTEPEARCLVFDLPGCENQHFQQDAIWYMNILSIYLSIYLYIYISGILRYFYTWRSDWIFIILRFYMKCQEGI